MDLPGPGAAIDSIIPILMPDLNPMVRKIISRKIKKVEKNLTAEGILAKSQLMKEIRVTDFVDLEDTSPPHLLSQASNPSELVVESVDLSSSTSTPPTVTRANRESRHRLVIPRPAPVKKRRKTNPTICPFLPSLFSLHPSSLIPSSSTESSLVSFDVTTEEMQEDSEDSDEKEDQMEDDDEGEGEGEVTGAGSREIEWARDKTRNDGQISSLPSSTSSYQNMTESSPRRRKKRESNPQFNLKTLISTFKSIQSGNFSGGLLQPLMVRLHFLSCCSRFFLINYFYTQFYISLLFATESFCKPRSIKCF